MYVPSVLQCRCMPCPQCAFSVVQSTCMNALPACAPLLRKVDEPYCSEEDGNCGNRIAAVIWFLSYYILVTFIFINIIIGVFIHVP